MTQNSLRKLLSRVAAVGLALALLAGCTSVVGTPGMEGAAGGTASSVDPAGDPNVGDETSDAPPSTALIAAALAAGEIDEATSLLYRTWVYFGDWRLPEQYIGADAPYELGLLAEVRDKLDGMPANIRAQVEPYLLRPEDPKSAFNAAVSDTSAGEQSTSGEADPPGLRGADSQRALLGAGGVTAGRAAAGVVREGETKKPPRPCVTGWDSSTVDGLNFRVWACRDAVAAAGISNADAMTAVAGMLQKYVPAMSADMGELIPDDPFMQVSGPEETWDKRADARIDVYVLPTGWLGPYRENYSVVPGYARTIQASPKVGVTTSSYVYVSTGYFDDMALLERMVVHELFHAFQNTHNGHVQAQWWSEGSAEWAASYYVRSDSTRLHEARLPVRQNTRFSLLAPRAVEDLAPYGAYLWPLFMEQQVGAESVFAVWKALAEFPAGVGNDAVLGVIKKQQLDVSANFAEFIMRAFNADLPGDPITPRFVELDGNFPDGLLPRALTVELSKEPLEIGELRVEGLGHFYADVDVPGLDPDPPDADVSITIKSDIAQHVDVAPTLEALVRSRDGTYERQRISYGGDGATVCVNGNLKLVLSNPATSALDAAIGSVYLERNYDDAGLPQPCTRIEATNPETLTPLSDDEIVAVDGTENDDKPDVAPIFVTVLDVKAKDVAEYRVEVTLTGETLTAPKKFDWALSEFDVLAPDKVYRKTIDVTLDKDLTDKNRDFTIDARLIRDATKVHSHEPTVELHGLKPCDPDEVDVTCELVGDLEFSFDGEYKSAVSHGTARTAHVGGTLSLRLGELQSGMLGPYDGYPNVGSTFDVSGSSRFEHYLSGETEGGPTSVDQTFVTRADESANMPAIGLENGMQAHILRIGDQTRLNIMVPIKQTISPTNVEMSDPDWTEQTSWEIGCPEIPTESFEGNVGFWTDGNADRDVFSLPQFLEDDFGSWNASVSEITFSCSKTWGPATWYDGDTGSMSYRLNGTLRWVRVDQ